jgi:hypothetical protein
MAVVADKDTDTNNFTKDWSKKTSFFSPKFSNLKILKRRRIMCYEITAVFGRNCECPSCFSVLLTEKEKMDWVELIEKGQKDHRDIVICKDEVCKERVEVTMIYNSNSLNYYRSKLKKNSEIICPSLMSLSPQCVRF